MTKAGGFRQKRKLTNREIEKRLDDLEARIDSFNPLVNAIVGELDRINTIVFTWLEENDKVYKQKCEKCERITYTPILEGMTPPAGCSFCGVVIGDEEE